MHDFKVLMCGVQSNIPCFTKASVPFLLQVSKLKRVKAKPQVG